MNLFTSKLKISLLIIYFIVHQSCLAQKKDEIHLVYKDIFYHDKVIDRIKSYDSKTAIYQVKQLYPDGNYKIKTVTLNLTTKTLKTFIICI
ncbi:hypothetical protein BOQ62_08030 [Chryseobacterium sp. CH21]|nr:hypothetical protein BOQ62_08030 [Chryseobacterium sp. CH21]